jgi:MFS family permease
MCIISYIVFPLAGQNKILLGSSRLVTGFFQVFMLVYFPVWVDFFGEKNKTRWVSYLQIGPPLGVFTGYALTAIFNEIGTYVSFVGWRWSFYIQILLLIPGGFI